MNETSKEILENYQVRKTKAQKTRFIEFMKTRYPELRVEEGGFPKNRNLVIGDVESARAVLSAHYDTCAVLPFPNFIMPKNLLVSIFYGVLIAVPIILVAVLAGSGVLALTDEPLFSLLAYFAVFITLFAAMFCGKPNKHTVNDNTSGVITLCELLGSLNPEERSEIAFVFFDNEENGLLGSSWFNKVHRAEMKDKLLINYDCVSDGDNIMLLPNKNAKKEYLPALGEAFCGAGDKNIIVETGLVYYPSDQGNFKKNIGVAAFRRCALGLYLNRIHTPKDTVMDERNIGIICDGTKKFLEKI